MPSYFYHKHVSELYDACFERYLEGEVEFRTVLMDIWYATTKRWSSFIVNLMESLG